MEDLNPANDEEKQAKSVRPWKGICYDDGTGRNVYYVDDTGYRQRKMPDNYVPEYFESGDRRYYFRGLCIRCRQPTPSILLTTERGVTGFCLNICENCIITSVGGFGTLRSRGDEVWTANVDTPKHAFIPLQLRAFDPDRERIIIQRSKLAKYSVNVGAKHRRNVLRAELVKAIAMDFHVQDGELISWGFEVYDEYFGTLNDKGKPDGLGCKFYNDKSVYVGHWSNGLRHSTEKALWQRPDASQYEGSWVKDYKHGRGVQTFPDGSIYTGDFAKGYEHGHGVKNFANGNRFEGRFRFGKIDGPGVMTYKDGTVERRVFKEPEVFHEKSIPEVSEHVPDNDEKFFEPPSLMSLCIVALAKTMHLHRGLVPPQLLHKRLPEYMKAWVAKEYLETMHPIGTSAFLDAVPNLAFKSLETINLKGVKFAHFDSESLLYFIGANSRLKSLQLTLNRLTPAAIDMLNKRLALAPWPLLETLDLSFNKLDATAVANLVTSLRANDSLKVLRLAGCNINANSGIILSRFLTENRTIEEVDVAFNSLQIVGAEAFAEMIMKNNSILRLSLRQNAIGNIGGEALVDALRVNRSIIELCIADNKVGVEVMTLLSGRLQGNIKSTANSVRAAELTIPAIHTVKKVYKTKKQIQKELEQQRQLEDPSAGD